MPVVSFLQGFRILQPMQSVTFAIAIWVATLRLTAFLAQGSLRFFPLIVPHGRRIFLFSLVQSAQLAGMLR